MPFWRIYYHLIWATKQRQPIITPAIEAQLFPYLVQKATELGIHVHAVNGWTAVCVNKSETGNGGIQGREVSKDVPART